MTSQQPGIRQSAPGLGQAGQDRPGADPDTRRVMPGDDPGGAPTVTWPSPYLSEGHSAPETYPAPAQPGQPKYGEPEAAFQSVRGYPLAGRPASGDRYGRQARAMAPRDPALAAGWERFAACSVDWFVIFVAAALPLLSPLLGLWHQLENVALQSQTLSQSAAQAAVYNVLLAPATTRTIIAFELLTLGIALVYFWVLPATWGTTLGKRAFGLRVVAAADRSGIGIRAAGLRAAAFLAGPAIFLLLPSYISWVGLLIWLVDGMAMAMDPGRQTLHDRAAGTAVICPRRAR